MSARVGYHRSVLAPGSRIAVVSPSGIFDSARLERGIHEVRTWGFELVEARNLGARHRYTAGTVVQRAEDLRWALTAPEIDAVWFARGGFGTAHLLSELPWDELDDRPVIGFSDATALFCAQHRMGHGRGIHGPVLHSLCDHTDEPSRTWLRSLLVEGRTGPLPVHHLAGSEQTVRGPVIGGNLSLLASLVGTPWAPRTEGCILVIEDVAEPPYRIDRMLSQLLQSGVLQGVAGLVLGEFEGCSVPDQVDWTLEEMILDLVRGLGIPVYGGLPVGHGSQNFAWIHGASAALDEHGLHVGVG
ncbi:MAG: LD-carboxypeptidase [Myxococcota bacterium]|nr:LD-carboxypeptidase [Myxococcota bacterium]